MPESLREVDAEPIREMAGSKPLNLQELVLENEQAPEYAGAIP